jgi:RNA polymerase subunit RPABC4/transcription elongation factor Spt4
VAVDAMTSCDHCGRETPDEPFCTWCGSDRHGGNEDPRGRLHHYAAHPGEHVAQPNLISTLLPHLPRQRLHEFRWALLAGLGAVVLLVALGQIVAATLTAAAVVPVLYLVYLYEAQVYRDEPVRTLGLTIVAGAVIGVATMIVAARVIPASSPLQLAGATGAVVGGTVLLPIIEELLKPLPVMLLRFRSSFNETVDGLAFGVAAGLGFAAAETLYNYSRVIGDLNLSSHTSSWLIPLLSIAITQPLLQGSCTGALTASIWRRGKRGTSRLIYLAGAPVAIIAHVAFTYVSWLLAQHGSGTALVLAWQFAVDAVLLLFIRFLLHRALCDEAEDFGLHPAVCPHCHRHVEGAAFCPHCGSALSARPRTWHGGLQSDEASAQGPPPAAPPPEPDAPSG